MAAKINMRLDKNEMPSQDPNVRNKNFLEVALGYTEEQALDEAARCLNCKNHPCVDGCPVNVRIPEFIQKIVEKDYEGAYQVIHQTSSLPAVCGRVCPQESQCEMHCVRGKKGDPVGIGRLERFVADWHNAHSTEAAAVPAPNGHKVAVIGSGPAGLTCAGDLAKKGYEVTVFEALHLAGGVLVYGIPEFRLPKAIVQKEVDGLKAMGVKVETNTVVGRTITIDELMQEYGFEAVFIGSGAGLPMFMNIPGENLKGVVGGGNVAMDAARCSKRLGAEVYVVYRRGMEELPARHEEVEHAIEEGVIFKTLNNPVQINGDEQDCVKSMTCIEMELGAPAASGRRRAGRARQPRHERVGEYGGAGGAPESARLRDERHGPAAPLLRQGRIRGRDDPRRRGAPADSSMREAVRPGSGGAEAFGRRRAQAVRHSGARAGPIQDARGRAYRRYRRRGLQRFDIGRARQCHRRLSVAARRSGGNQRDTLWVGPRRAPQARRFADQPRRQPPRGVHHHSR